MARVTLPNGRQVSRDDRVYSTLDQQWARVLRIDGQFVTLADSETGQEMPDEVQVSQLR